MAQSKQFSNRGMNVSKSEMTYTLYLVGIPRDQNVELNLYNHFCQFETKNRLSWDTMVTHQQLPWHLLKVKLQKRQMTVLSSHWTIRTFKWHWFLRMPLHRRKPICVLCNTKLASKWGLKDHVKRVHGETRYKCTACKAPFASENMLNKRISDRIKDTVRPREQMRSLQRQIEINEGKYFKALTMIDTNKKAFER